MAKFIKIYNEKPSQELIEEVVSILKKGGLIIFPTDTVYGLGCDLKNNKALERVAMLKGVKLEKAKFKFEQEIVFNPKNEQSYLYLSKIFNQQNKKKLEEENLNTVILLNPKNEEANYMLMEIELKRSNYSKVKELADNFSKICNRLCDKRNSILESLKNLEPKNES